MSYERVAAIVHHEWLGLRRNRQVLLGLAVLPILLTLFVIGFSAWGSNANPGSMNNGGSTPSELMGAPVTVQLVVQLNEMFEFFFLVMPASYPLIIAATSIVQEKKAKSLEPLLASPITTTELLLGKSVAAALPSLVMCWGGVALCAAGLYFLAPPLVLAFFIRPAWVVAMSLLTPLLASLAGLLGVSVSSRATDEKAAGLWATLLMTVVFLLPCGLLISGRLLSLWALLGGALSVAALNWLVLRVAVRVFQREEILTRGANT
ncbi:MAG: ABC transporter permease subunit [Polyangiaceae bacterium]